MIIDAEYDDEGQVTHLRIPLDDRTFAWLVELAESCHVEPALVAAAILRDVRLDDENEHLCEPAPRAGAVSLN